MPRLWPSAHGRGSSERFYRLERSAKIHGTGLGPALVAAVVGLHEIQLSVDDSAPGLCIKMRFRSMTQSTRDLNVDRTTHRAIQNAWHYAGRVPLE